MSWKTIAQNQEKDPQRIPAIIDAEHKNNTHSEAWCSPETCPETAQSHATDHALCIPYYCDYLADLHEQGNHTECRDWCESRLSIDIMHSLGKHSLECNPQSCPAAAEKHALNDHSLCGEDSICGIMNDWLKLGNSNSFRDYDSYRSGLMDYKNPLNKVYPDRDYIKLTGFPGISQIYSVCFNCLDEVKKDRGQVVDWSIPTYYADQQGKRAYIWENYKVPFEWDTEEPGFADGDETYPSCDSCGEAIFENPVRLRTEAVKFAHDRGGHNSSACAGEYCFEVNKKHQNDDHSLCSNRYCPVMQEYHKDRTHKNCTEYSCHIQNSIAYSHNNGTHSEKCMPENCSDVAASHTTDHKLCNPSFCKIVEQSHIGDFSHKLCNGYWCRHRLDIDRRHKAGLHSEFCYPLTCEAMEQSHSTDHVLCAKAERKFCHQKEINLSHSRASHHSFYCKPDTCNTMKISHENNHFDCSTIWCEDARKRFIIKNDVARWLKLDPGDDE